MERSRRCPSADPPAIYLEAAVAVQQGQGLLSEALRRRLLIPNPWLPTAVGGPMQPLLRDCRGPSSMTRLSIWTPGRPPYGGGYESSNLQPPTIVGGRIGRPPCARSGHRLELGSAFGFRGRRLSTATSLRCRARTVDASGAAQKAQAGQIAQSPETLLHARQGTSPLARFVPDASLRLRRGI